MPDPEVRHLVHRVLAKFDFRRSRVGPALALRRFEIASLEIHVGASRRDVSAESLPKLLEPEQS